MAPSHETAAAAAAVACIVLQWAERLRVDAVNARDMPRGSDPLARVGGEEILVALPDTPRQRPAEVYERLRLAV